MRATITTSMVAAVLLAISLTVASYAVDNPHITPQVSPSAILTPDEPVEPIPEPEETETPTETPTIETTAQYEYWEDIPLADEVQEHVFSLCEEKGIDPEIVFAMIWRESRYQADAIGDSGRAFGLMQVHPQWHSARMDRLGVTDLLDPIQNVTVGIDFLDELYRRYGDITHAVVAYNRGNYNGEITYYAQDVLAEAERIKESSS